jgi:hypothetical protein
MDMKTKQKYLVMWGDFGVNQWLAVDFFQRVTVSTIYPFTSTFAPGDHFGLIG